MSLDPTFVIVRLAELRALYVPETVEEARLRLATPRAEASLSPDVVSTRLAELRALLELTRHLHQATAQLAVPRAREA